MNWRRWRGLGLAVATSLLALEALLQAGSWVLWVTTRTEVHAAARSPGHTVLCVGDSFTYGLGATSRERAYPQTLQTLLRERSGDPAWSVVNGGWPGQDSSDVLRKLPDQLTEHHPAFVCVMVGCNDWWKKPARLDAARLAADHGGFRWEWRTAKLAALVAQLFRPRNGQAAVRGDGFPAGTWRFHDLRFLFGTDQTLSVSWSFPPIAVARVPWRADGTTLCLAESLLLRWELSGSELRLTAEGVPAPLVLTASDEDGADGMQAVLRDHLRAAIARCRAAGAEPILMSYPAPMSGVEEVMRPLAAQEHVVWIHHRERFDQELRTRAHDELFVADGHCADPGYRLVAEDIVPVLLAASARR